MKKETMDGKNISVNLSDNASNPSVAILTVKGFIDTVTAPEFEKVFHAALNAQKYKLVVDLEAVNYISSAGWGVFISQIKRIRAQKGDLVLVGMNPEVGEVFELLEFNSILKTFPTVEAAVQKAFTGK